MSTTCLAAAPLVMLGARPWLASLILHAALLAVLGVATRSGRRVPDDRDAIEIEVVAAPDSRESAAPAPDQAEPDPPGEPEGAAAAAAPARSKPRAARPDGGEAANREEAGADGDEVAAGGEGALGLGWGLGALGTGSGAGGSGGGAGVGIGGPARRGTPAGTPRPVSRARPPRLVYPKRFRDERGGEVFVAVLTIDEDGWVVGARLAQGVNPFADQKAMEAVWRFHYQPALDRAGRPTSARVVQRFMVE